MMQEHGDVALPYRRRRPIEHREALPNRLQQRLRRQRAEIFDDAVIRKNLHLIVRERDRQKRVPLAGLTRQTGPAQLLARARRTRRAVVPICDV
jgi:hypothetical protein